MNNICKFVLIYCSLNAYKITCNLIACLSTYNIARLSGNYGWPLEALPFDIGAFCHFYYNRERLK